MSDFVGKNVVVTGASGGLGVSVVSLLLERGAICRLPMLEASVPAHLPWVGHERAIITTSVRVDDEVAVQTFFDSLPSLHASVHLVGGFAWSKLEDTSLAELQKMFALNAATCFVACREAVRAMRRTGEGGNIVNVAARPVLTPTIGMTAYAASKAAVAAITQTIAAEVHDEGILVNAVVPSIIDTEANRSSMPDADHSKWPKPSELAETIAFLASPRNTLTSGALIPVYGRS